MPYSTSLPSTILFLSLFILAFFPSLFVFLLKLPLNALTLHSFNSNVPVTTRLNKCFSSEAVLDPPPGPPMAFFQKTFTLPSHSRGSYLITNDVVKALPELKSFKVGILHLFVQHTSCALSLNENWDEDVRADMSDALDRIVPEDKGGRGSKGLYRHDAEGSDDMPAHIKSALIGASVTIPITNGKLNTGTWQGIWYLEFRNSKNTRNVVATIQGERTG